MLVFSLLISNCLFFLLNFMCNLVSLRLSAFYVFVCVCLLARWRFGVRIVGIFPLPGCVLGACVGNNGPIGCTNNNYASREICKKCGRPKEVAAMPATAIPGASLPTYPNYFARAPNGYDQRFGFFGSGAPQQSLNWSLGGNNKYGFQSASTWPAGDIHSNNIAHTAPTNPPMTTNGWRNGDWICSCGFHNYSSRMQCKKCNASVPTAAPPIYSPPATGLGTKRLASDEPAHGLDSKRLNAGQTYGTMPQTYTGADITGLSNYNQPNVKHSSYTIGSSSLTPNFQVNHQTATIPSPIFGKGAKQWRDGDWMCAMCSNHNYASRAQCNRCKTEREVLPGAVTVA